MWTNTLYDDIFSLYDDSLSLYDDTFSLYDDTSSLYDDTFPSYDDTFSLYDDTSSLYDDTFPLYDDTSSSHQKKIQIKRDLLKLSWIQESVTDGRTDRRSLLLYPPSDMQGDNQSAIAAMLKVQPF